jgi:hypothetical protein
MSIVHARGAQTPWLVVVLALFLSLGHACELPASAVLPHVHGAAHDAHDASHDHPGEPAEIGCDAVPAVRGSTAAVEGDQGSDAVAVALFVDVGTGGLSRALASAAPLPRSRRLPLFLLHASLLI